MSYSELNSYFEQLDYNPRSCTTKMVVKAWKKAHQALHAIKGVKLCDPNQLAIDYLRRCFVIKSQMEWWIKNCASSGSPDDYTKSGSDDPDGSPDDPDGSPDDYTKSDRQSVHLIEEECSTDRILEWIGSRSFKERVDYAYWEDPGCKVRW